jgi:hypothetical protein
MVGVEREVLGLLKKFGEYGAGLYARQLRRRNGCRARRPSGAWEGQQADELRDGDPGALAHLASVLINEYALADVALARSEFQPVSDGALRAYPAC